MTFPQAAHRSWSALFGRLSLVLLMVGLCVGGSPVVAAQSPRRIFLLEGLTATDVSVQQSVEAFRQRLKERSSEDTEVYSDILDLGRFQGPANEDRLVQFLGAKFAQVRPDVVIPVSRSAVDFVVRHRGDLARGIPIVYCCAPALMGDAQNIPPDIPGVVVDFDYAGTLLLAQRLQPNAKTLVIISGASDIDHRRDQEALGDLQPFLQNYDTKYLTGLPFDELLKQVSLLPRDSIVLMRRVFEDGSGRSRGPEFAADVSKASAAPVYSGSATYIGSGIVGGRIDNYVGQGSKIADLVLEILSGKDPSTLPHQTRLPLQYRVDARQMERWGLAESSLPPGTSVEFRQRTLWQQYRTPILLALLALAVQAGIIALLLIQKRKRLAAEKLLKESEDRMAFAAASTNTGIWRLDVASGRLWATPHCRSMFGIAADVPLTWELFRDVVHPDDRQAFDNCLRPPTRIRHPMAGEFRVALPGREVSWFVCRGHTVFDANGKPLQVSGIFIDVTPRKSAEAEADFQRTELTHLMRVVALGELSNGLANALSQPLTAIVANAAAAQSIARKGQDKEAVEQILKEIAEDGNRMGRVIHRLRGLLKKGEHQSKPVNLNRLIESTLSLLRPELVNREIKLEMDLKSDLPLISGDSVQVQQVLLNLMMNAMEAMASTPPPERTLGVGTRTAPEGCVEAVVTDHGPGMAPDELERLFRPFFTTKERGLGLGLWICSTIVASHGGRLNVSNAPGGGATATLSLPITASTGQKLMTAADASLR